MPPGTRFLLAPLLAAPLLGISSQALAIQAGVGAIQAPNPGIAVPPSITAPTPVIAANANPTGGQVTAGRGSIEQVGNDTSIHQDSQALWLSWQSFDIGADSAVHFLQPDASSIAVNRILGGDGSVIKGRLDSNGQVFLINPNGVLFGEGAQVNVGGLVASTLDVADSDIGGDTLHFNGDGRGGIVNRGSITTTAPGGYVALLGHRVSNQGTISARLGSVALAGGSAVTLSFDGSRLLAMQVDASTLHALADNRQLVVADGGQVLMSAGAKDSLLASVVNNSGVIQARTVENRDGRIVLLGGMAAGSTHVAGTLDASAPNGGNGGFIETSATHVQVADGTHITTLANDGDTGVWLIDPVDFTIAASGGDMTGALLSTSLASADVVIQSTSGVSGAAGDINVNDQVSWSANQLTLNAQNNININADLNGTGTAKLALEYGQASVGGTGSGYTLRGGKINLAAGDNFSTRQGSGGATQVYTVITSLGVAGDTGTTSLQGIDNNLAGHYALGSDIDASATSGWNSGAGFDPIGALSGRFTGSFDGLGHTISALAINRPATNYVGLFGFADSATEIRNVGLVGVDITGNRDVAGLMGATLGNISNAYATGRVVGAIYPAGLVGVSTGAITNSYSTATVSGVEGAGGLVGYSAGSISNSYATGQVVSSSVYAGGLVAINLGGTIKNSYATGTVSGGNNYAGGLTAYNASGGAISNSYATGAVNGAANAVGGLVGVNDGTISNSYATGLVTGGAQEFGGLVGNQFVGGSVSNSYWDIQTTGQTVSAGGAGLTTAQMRDPASFAAWGTNISAVGGSAAVWRIYAGDTAPLLRTFLTDLAVANVGATYKGAAFAGRGDFGFRALTPGYWLPSTSVNENLILGDVDANAGGPAINVGTYTLDGGLYSGQMGYDIDIAAATLTIRPAALTIGTSNVSKTYDGGLSAAGTAIVSGGTLFGSDALSGGSFSFTDKNAGAGKTVTVAGVTVGDGNNGGNYAVTYAANGSSSIAALGITVAATGRDKVYDGTTADAVTLASAGVLSGDTVSFTGIGSFADKNVGNAKAVTVSGIAASGADAGNYSFNTTASTTAAISRLGVTVAATGSDKVYDGGTADAVTLASTGVLSGDTVSFTGAGSFANKNVGTAKAVSVSGIAASGADAGNYSFNTTAATSADITPATLTYIADPAHLWTGQVPNGLSGTVSGLVGGETLADATEGILSWATPATAGSGPGLYAINGSGLTAGNYVFKQVVGNVDALTVERGITPYVVAAALASLQAPSDTPSDDDRNAAGMPDIRIADGGVRLP